MDQLVPFQRSARVEDAAALLKNPTAVHRFDPMHDTSLSALTAALAGLGVPCRVQPVPFHRSARVTSIPVLLT